MQVDNVCAVSTEYPNILATGGLHDPRVGYWEPAKYVAKLRHTKTDKNMLLFHCEMGAGGFPLSTAVLVPSVSPLYKVHRFSYGTQSDHPRSRRLQLDGRLVTDSSFSMPTHHHASELRDPRHILLSPNRFCSGPIVVTASQGSQVLLSMSHSKRPSQFFAGSSLTVDRFFD